MSDEIQVPNCQASGSRGEIPAGSGAFDPKSGMAGPSESRFCSYAANACMVLGILSLLVFLFTFADLPNRLHIPRSISWEVEASRTQTGYLSSLSAALIALAAGYTGRMATKSRRVRFVGLLCASCPVVMLFLQGLLVMEQRMEGREPARRAHCINNLKQITLALLNYESVNGGFPPRVHRDRQGRPLLSWRVLILPYLDQNELFSRFHLDEPWDSPHNQSLIESMPSILACPAQATWIQNQTVYQVVDGPGAFLESSGTTRLNQVSDGPSETIAVLEGPVPVPWTSPQDVLFRANQPFPGWEATHPGGINCAFVDGSLRFLKQTIWESVLKALVTRAGGERISPDSY